VRVVIAVGAAPGRTLRAFAEHVGDAPPSRVPRRVGHGEVVVWRRDAAGPPARMRPIQPQTEHYRHRRKYAQGDVGDAKSFYFRGPGGRLNLRAQNLALFSQIAEGVDDETWLFHLRRGDYSRWFREAIKDAELAEEAARVEQARRQSPARSRARIRAAIEERYTAAA
jgi:hypothetical protein